MERRTVPRVEPVEPMTAKVKAALPARVVDISSRGAQVELASSLKPNVACDIKVSLPTGDFCVRAMVRRCRAHGFGLDESNRKVLMYRAGLEFDELSPEALAQLSSNILFESMEKQSLNKTSNLGSDEVNVELPPVPSATGPVVIHVDADNIRKIVEKLDDK